MKAKILLCICASLVCTTLALAGDPGSAREGSSRSITLPAPVDDLADGPGKDTTGIYCGICHSLDYITTQPKFPRARWRAAVAKMIKTYGAPISETNAEIIVDYITTYYGAGG
ncbi:MAG TPA: hypothetical protein VN642_09945 [Dongiaceae bacterium]|nr:hypothetical protein [Dongiaceae bacterium]